MASTDAEVKKLKKKLKKIQDRLEGLSSPRAEGVVFFFAPLQLAGKLMDLCGSTPAQQIAPNPFCSLPAPPAINPCQPPSHRLESLINSNSSLLSGIYTWQEAYPQYQLPSLANQTGAVRAGWLPLAEFFGLGQNVMNSEIAAGHVSGSDIDGMTYQQARAAMHWVLVGYESVVYAFDEACQALNTRALDQTQAPGLYFSKFWKELGFLFTAICCVMSALGAMNDLLWGSAQPPSTVPPGWQAVDFQRYIVFRMRALLGALQNARAAMQEVCEALRRMPDLSRKARVPEPSSRVVTVRWKVALALQQFCSIA